MQHRAGSVARLVLGALLGLVSFAAVVVLVVKWAPALLADSNLSGKDSAEDRGRVRTAVLATFAGLIAIVGAVFTGLSYRLNQAGQITERFTRAIDQLGKEETDVRLGGIYALERIARDSRADHPQVVEVLTAFVREHTRTRSPESLTSDDAQETARPTFGALAWALLLVLLGAHRTAEVPAAAEGQEADQAVRRFPTREDTPRLPTDVQAAMTVLARRDRSQDAEHGRLNLTDTDLRRLVLWEQQGRLGAVDMRGANLQHAHLPGVHLEGADLREAHLEGAWLAQAHLESCKLVGSFLAETVLGEAHLQGAWLQGVHLESTDLRAADLSGAYMNDAHLDGAMLAEATMRGTHLGGASFERATVHSIHLENAYLRNANLRGAWFAHAHLENAILTGANLDDAHQLDEANLTGATYDAETVWPGGFDPQAVGARALQEGETPPFGPARPAWTPTRTTRLRLRVARVRARIRRKARDKRFV